MAADTKAARIVDSRDYSDFFELRRRAINNPLTPVANSRIVPGSGFGVGADPCGRCFAVADELLWPWAAFPLAAFPLLCPAAPCEGLPADGVELPE